MPRIMSAPTGARRLKDAHPGIPLTTEEIAKTAREVAAAGADEFHLHVRDDEGVHSLDAGRYREAMAAVAEAAPELDIQITTESAGIYEVEDQLACLDAITPTYATAAIRETMRDNAVAEKIYALTAERNIRMQHILFDREDIDLLRSAYASGMIAPESRDAIFVLGRYVPPRLAQAWELKPLLDEAADLNLDWAVCAFGKHETACLTEALERDGSVRVGFENNIHMPDGSLAISNAEQVANMARIRDSLSQD
ncbi:MAG: 3-keto-5-aminohexanoate cleavage protein [Paracoccaceae bacterium]|jgi:uncharacterized protein (DUF849 family)|nr:3-keto-5-aminohexanoate cleavage protein [Paracoccaceae bacterium]